MHTTKIELDKNEARELYRKYKEHAHWSEPIDDEIRQVYQRIAQGRTVIRALQSVVAAGLNDEGLPKLAIARADVEACAFRGWCDGSASFETHDFRRRIRARDQRFEFPAGSFVFPKHWPTGQAQVPIVPVHLRPKRGMANYHILWEAEWGPLPPVDPLLLRRFGRSDMWLVCAAWDLTEVERAALEGRMNG